MQDEARINLLERVAGIRTSRGAALDAVVPRSILSLTAASYGSRPHSEDATVPTGFDPAAVALFEAIVEGAYLVATADGTFDPAEQRVFERVVMAACGGAVAADQIALLVADLGRLLRKEGLEDRLNVIGRAVTKEQHAREVLRVSSLIAQSSEDVSPVERQMLERLAAHCGLRSTDVDAALSDASRALTEALRF